MLDDNDIIWLKRLAREAGRAILEVFDTDDFGTEVKSDSSPLTKADKASHNIITDALKVKYPDIPVISEEDIESAEFGTRKEWESFWLVDPLDGTKEFIKREKDFTVNIGLIRNGKPYWGVVYAPARDWLYSGGISVKSKKEFEGSEITLKDNYGERKEIIAVRSKSHSKPDEEKLLKKYNVTDTINMGSSLKLCMVAEGSADLYYRAGPTWEWDTAAAHAVCSGCGTLVLENDAELCYNKKTLKMITDFYA